MARDWKQTIRDLLKLAYSYEDENHPERVAHEAKAMYLMAKMGIEEASLSLNAPKESITETKVWFKNPYGRSKARLYCAIMDTMNCYVLKLPAKKHGVTMYHIFGLQADIDRGEFLYGILLQQSTTLVTRVKAPEGENLTSYRVSWWMGFAAGIRDKLSTANTEAVRESASGTALVLADRKDRAEGSARVQYPSIVHTRDSYRGSGYADGKTAGRNANLYGTNSLRKGARGALN